jgi:hypothetical protein
LKAINCDLVGHIEFDPASAFSRHTTDHREKPLIATVIALQLKTTYCRNWFATIKAIDVT